MKKSRYSESKIIQILNEGESGIPIADLCREHGISRSAYYKWKAKYGGMNVNELKHLRELETENRRLKQMYAELSLDHKILLINYMNSILKKKLKIVESYLHLPKKNGMKHVSNYGNMKIMMISAMDVIF